MTWEFREDDSAKGRYDMILGRDILRALGLKQKLSKQVIVAGDGYLKLSTVPMIDLGKL